MTAQLSILVHSESARANYDMARTREGKTELFPLNDLYSQPPIQMGDVYKVVHIPTLTVSEFTITKTDVLFWVLIKESDIQCLQLKHDIQFTVTLSSSMSITSSLRDPFSTIPDDFVHARDLLRENLHKGFLHDRYTRGEILSFKNTARRLYHDLVPYMKPCTPFAIFATAVKVQHSTLNVFFGCQQVHSSALYPPPPSMTIKLGPQYLGPVSLTIQAGDYPPTIFNLFSTYVPIGKIDYRVSLSGTQNAPHYGYSLKIGLLCIFSTPLKHEQIIELEQKGQIVGKKKFVEGSDYGFLPNKISAEKLDEPTELYQVLPDRTRTLLGTIIIRNTTQYIFEEDLKGRLSLW